VSPERIVVVDDCGCYQFAELPSSRSRYYDRPRPSAGRLKGQVERYVAANPPLRTYRGERIFVLHEILDPRPLARDPRRE
jgi:hypothetical protein